MNPTLYVRITDNYPSVLYLSQTTVTIAGWAGQYEFNKPKIVYVNVGPIGSDNITAGAEFTSQLGTLRLRAIYGALISWVGRESPNSIFKSSVTDQALVTP